MSIALVCGGRDFWDEAVAFAALDRYRAEHSIRKVVHGGARGADTLAGKWAADRGITIEKYPADWAAHGKAAGAIRNQEMLDEGKPDFVIAFPGGRGTADMIRRAEKAGVPVHRVVGVKCEPLSQTRPKLDGKPLNKLGTGDPGRT